MIEIKRNKYKRKKSSRNRSEQIRGRRFKVKDLGDARYCLGVEIHRDREIVTLSQSGYIDSILEHFHMTDCKPISTPMAPGLKLTTGSQLLGQNLNFPHWELIDVLRYSALGTRPDIRHAVSSLSQFSERPDQTHWIAAVI